MDKALFEHTQELRVAIDRILPNYDEHLNVSSINTYSWKYATEIPKELLS